MDFNNLVKTFSDFYTEKIRERVYWEIEEDKCVFNLPQSIVDEPKNNDQAITYIAGSHKLSDFTHQVQQKVTARLLEESGLTVTINFKALATNYCSRVYSRVKYTLHKVKKGS